MQTQNRVLADLAKVASAATGIVAGAGREARDAARLRLQSAVGGLDFVSRDEFEAVRAMAANARAEVDALRVEIAALRAATATPTVTG